MTTSYDDDQISKVLAALYTANERLEEVSNTLDSFRVATDKRLDLMQEYVDKSLHLVSKHYELYGQRSARPYYALDNGWALTSLDTGSPFFVNSTDRNITPWIIMGGHWERNVERVMLDYIRPDMQVIDIGAHFGYYTVKLGERLSYSGNLHAFEPNPEVNAVCEENIKINNLASKVTLHKVALGDENTTAILTRSSSNMASANLLGEQTADFSVEVRVQRLDDVLTTKYPIDLIKLDAEGYEKRILDGAAATLRRSPNCALMIELSLDRWERFASLEELLPCCGGGKELFAVRDDGLLQHYELNQVKPFLLSQNFHECYFFIVSRERLVANVGHLLTE